MRALPGPVVLTVDESHLPPRERTGQRFELSAQAALALRAPRWVEELDEHMADLLQTAERARHSPPCDHCGWRGGAATVAIMGKLVDAKSKLVTSPSVHQAPSPPPELDLSLYSEAVRAQLVAALTAAADEDRSRARQSDES